MAKKIKESDLSLAEFIGQVKREILSTEYTNEKSPLFKIDEISIEASFKVIDGLEGGLDFKIVTFGAKSTDEAVQKVIVKLTPIIDVEQLAKAMLNDSAFKAKVEEASKKALFKSDSEQGVIGRDR